VVNLQQSQSPAERLAPDPTGGPPEGPPGVPAPPAWVQAESNPGGSPEAR